MVIRIASQPREPASPEGSKMEELGERAWEFYGAFTVIGGMHTPSIITVKFIWYMMHHYNSHLRLVYAIKVLH